MLEVRLLGQFDVRRDGQPVEIPSRPAQSLLAYLTLTAGTAHRREKLAGLFWPDATEANARTYLRQALWRLRKSLEADPPAVRPYLLVDEISVAFDATADLWLDTAVLEVETKEQLLDDLTSMVSVYRGELLPGFYDEWVVLERERLQAVFERKVERLLERLVEGQRWREVLDWGERWIALGHTPEPAYRAMMLAHAGLADAARVAAVFQRCVGALRRDLGVEPSEQTRVLYDWLAKGEKPAGLTARVSFQSRYRLGAEIGRGGMGVVYHGHDTVLDRDVAVKLVSAAALGTEGRARLLREAQAAAKLNHPNIVAVHDAGEADGVPFIVMELVEGDTLHDRRPQALDDILPIVRQICAALDHAHAHGIVHRDLKPENIFITPEQKVKLGDFGLARVAEATRLTEAGAVVGTVWYTAPEQALGKPMDGRADLYALGVILYELTTGRLPFTGDDPLAILAQHLNAPVVPPREHRADIPAELEALIVRLMSKQPEERPASAVEVVQMLDELMRPVELSRERAQVPPGNLPAPVTPFVGRAEELAEITKRLDDPDCRLLTLLGTGGIGKTRLALQAASQRAKGFGHGAYFVSLAPLNSPEFLISATAKALRLTFSGQQDPKEQLLNYLRHKELLLVMDNFEHLLEGATLLTEMLVSAPGVKCLVTSRERLSLQGEWILEVQGLHYPEIAKTGGADVESYSAVQLFVQTARRVQSSFTPSEVEQAGMVRICQLVAGMPLGIELAAAWVRTLACRDIADEIERNLNFLTTSLRDVPERHRSLRAAFDHSWNLLSDEERSVFQRLSVFQGGFEREGAERVAGASLPVVSALVDKSLVRWISEARYEMHELLRQYAQDRLLEAGEEAEARNQHFEFFLALAERSEPELQALELVDWLNQLETEHDNLRAGLAWSLENGVVEKSLRFSVALTSFWHDHSHLSEGRQWLEKTLAAPGIGTLPASMRAQALDQAGWLALRQADFEQAQIGFEAGLALRREIGDTPGIASSLISLGGLAAYRGDFEQAKVSYGESLALARELGDKKTILTALGNLGLVALAQGDYKRAVHLLEENLALQQELGERFDIAWALIMLGYAVIFHDHDYERSGALLAEGLSLYRQLGDKLWINHSLDMLATLATARRQPIRAARLAGAAEALRETISAPIPSSFETLYKRNLAALRAQLDDAAFASAWAEGLAMTLEQAVAYALEDAKAVNT